MPSIADEMGELLALMSDVPPGTPPEGLSMKEIAALLKWPASLVNERLVGLGGKVRHQKVRIKGESAVRYRLNGR